MLNTEFEELWAQLKTELNLCDEDLMGYKVKIHNGLAVLGWLKQGKVYQVPRYYPHPSAAKKAAESYIAKNPGHKYEVIKWISTDNKTVL